MKFKLCTTPDGKLYPRAVLNGHCSTEEMMTRISESCSLTSGDVKSVLMAVSSCMQQSLSRGETVKIDGLGTFSVSLSRMKSDGNGEKDFRSQDVCLSGINFQPEPLFARGVKNSMSFHRLADSSSVPVAKREEVVRSLGNEQGMFSQEQYRVAVGVSRYQCKKDLNRFVEEGLLTRLYLSGRTVYYKLAEKEGVDE